MNRHRGGYAPQVAMVATTQAARALSARSRSPQPGGFAVDGWRENLEGAAAITKMTELAMMPSTCAFCTSISTGRRVETRPMAVQHIDERGVPWFLRATDSHKNEQLAADRNVQLRFQGFAHADFLTIFGHPTISADRAKIKDLWNPLLKTWFTEGVDDPRISVIKVEPAEAYHRDTKHHRAIAFAKTVVGAIAGKTLDDSIQGDLRV